MARIRSLKIGFFTNEALCSLSPMHRLLFAGLWVIADREGRLEDRPRRIKAELFPYDDADVDALLNDLARAKFITRYVDGGTALIAIDKFLTHQYPHHREPASKFNAPPPVEADKHEAEVPALGQPEASTGKSSYRPGGSLVFGSLVNGSLGSGSLGSGEGATSALAPRWTQTPSRRTNGLVTNHRNCFEVTPSACARGICVPLWLGQEWRQQYGDDLAAADAAIGAVVDAAVAALPPTGPIGDDPKQFWRAVWRAAHGSSAPASGAPKTKGLLTLEAAKRVALARMQRAGAAS